jgi:hypothetical protein
VRIRARVADRYSQNIHGYATVGSTG